MNKKSNLGVNIKINGEQICKAGLDKENFVLTTITTLVHREDGSSGLIFQVGGLDSAAKEHVRWHTSPISLGDEITIDVIEGPFDPPAKRIPADTLESKLQRYCALKEELKEHIEK